MSNPIMVVDLGPEKNYVLDTGPLLCLGGSKYLRGAFLARCHGKTHWVEAVRQELSHQSRRTDPIGRAASAYNGRGASWLPVPVAFTVADDSDLSPIKGRLKTLGDAKALRKGRPLSTDLRAHLGEAQSILHARRNQHTLLAHDDDARAVAGEHGVPVGTLVDLARRLVAEGARPRELADGFMSLQRDGIDTGEHLTGPLALMPRRHSGTP